MAEPLRLQRGIHYGDYVQSGENIYVRRLGNADAYEFTIEDERRSGRRDRYKSFRISPDSDLSLVDPNILDELSIEMGYCGESEDDNYRYAKFSQTRAHIDAYAISNREPEPKPRNMAWVNDPATDKQKAYLRSLGYDGPEPATKGEAGKLISTIKTEQEAAHKERQRKLEAKQWGKAMYDALRR